MLNVVDDFFGDVATGDFFNTKSRRGINLKHERATTRAHQIDTSDMKAHGFSGFDGDAFFLVGQFDADTFPAFMKVATEIVVERLAFHTGDHARTDHEGTDVFAGGFFDVFLKEDIGSLFVIKIEGLKSGFGRFLGFGEHDAVAVGAGSEFDDNRQTDLLQKIVNISGIAGDESFGRVDAGFGEDLLRAQFVAGASNSDRTRGNPGTLHLELTDDGTTVAGHVVGNTRNDSIKTREGFAVIIDIGMLVIKRKVAILVFDDADLKAALLGFGDEALSGIIGIAIRENCDIHNVYIVPLKVEYVNMELWIGLRASCGASPNPQTIHGRYIS